MEYNTNSPSVSRSSDEHVDSLLSASASGASHKRNRTQLSCTNCRHGKLKCDRKEPCSQCTKKGKAALCTFPTPVRRKPPASMQNRLRHLESLVKGVMTGQSPSAEYPMDDMSIRTKGVDVFSTATANGEPREHLQAHGNGDAPAPVSGQILLRPNESTYVGATHWAAILEDVSLLPKIRRTPANDV